jgi:hypothetical protein
VVYSVDRNVSDKNTIWQSDFISLAPFNKYIVLKFYSTQYDVYGVRLQALPQKELLFPDLSQLQTSLEVLAGKIKSSQFYFPNNQLF